MNILNMTQTVEERIAQDVSATQDDNHAGRSAEEISRIASQTSTSWSKARSTSSLSLLLQHALQTCERLSRHDAWKKESQR